MNKISGPFNIKMLISIGTPFVMAVFSATLTVGYVAYPLFISDNIMKGVLGAGIVFLMLPKNIIYRFEENINNNEENSMQKLLEERLTGAARKARGESGVSGDNYSLKELENGQVLMGISDGMGYGASACLESETVIELLEQLLDSGFDGDTALKMINSVMIMNSEEEHPATLDYGVIDLHSGVCDLVKIGAATTFVKRGTWVETIKSTSMPLGMFSEVDYDTTSKKLYDGDLVIMVSDGVIDALDCEDNDSKLVEIIRDIQCTTPKEVADRILENAVLDKSRLTDDMTVLVTGIWENNKKIA